MRLVPIECVKPNTIIGKTLYDIEGRILVRAGVALSEGIISKIKDINILLVVCAVAGCAPARPVNSVLLAMRCFEIAGRREYFCGLGGNIT